MAPIGSVALITACMAATAFAFRAPDGEAGKKPVKGQQNAAQAAQPSPFERGLSGIQKVRIDDLIDSAATVQARGNALRIKGRVDSDVPGLFAKKLRGRGSEMRLIKVQTDPLGNRHVRLQQYHRGIPVYGSDVVVHVNKDDAVYGVNGSFAPRLDVTIAPAITGGQAARAATANVGANSRVRGDTTAMTIFDGKLAYEIVVDSGAGTVGRWKCFIDAATGIELFRVSIIAPSAPGKVGARVPVSGNRLTGEDGAVVTMTGWHDAGGNYFLYDTVARWGVFNLTVSDWEQRATSAWGSSDRYTVSVGKNLETTQAWVKGVLGMASYDNANGFAKANVHDSSMTNNAYWDGAEFHFCVCDSVTTRDLGVLDVVAHEYGHAITQYSSNLQYTYETGALNESFSDIIGTLVEFASQPDGRASYPSALSGRADWLIGEDAWLSGAALRDMRNPQRFDQASFYKGTNWYAGSGDNGGVHYNSGVQNFAFYLLSEGGSGSNDGHVYDVQAIGVTDAGKIALYADQYLLTSTAQYQDACDAWVSAALTLGYSAAVVQSVENAWSACGLLVPERHLAAAPASIDFGPVGINVTDTATLTLYNSGGLTATVASITSTNPVFSVIPLPPLTVIGGEQLIVKVKFKPLVAATQTGTLTIQSDASDNPLVTIHLSGSGTLPAAMTLSPLSVSRTLSRGDSVSVLFTITNTGTAPLKYRAVSQFDLYQYGAGGATALPTGPVTVLLVTDTNGTTNHFVSALKATGGISKIDTLNARNATPTLSNLLAYSIVYIGKDSPNPWKDKVGLGNALADYVDAGGHVCLMGAALVNNPNVPGWELGGRIVQPDYSPLKPAPNIIGGSTPSKVIYDTKITKGVSSLNAFVVCGLVVQGNGVSVGKYEYEGYDIGAYNPSKPVVALNMQPFDGEWDGDLPRMAANVIGWCRFDFAYRLDAEGQQRSVAAGSSSQITMTFNSRDLTGDIYTGSLAVFNNDPAKADPLLVPLGFSVSGTSMFSVLPASVAFGNVSSGKRLSLNLTNSGSKATTVASITSSNPAFRHLAQALPLRLPAYSTLVLGVQYTPNALGAQSGTLTFVSDASVNPTVTVALSGTGVTPPSGALSTSLLQFSLKPTDAPSAKTFTITNSGGDSLTYRVSVLDQTARPVAAAPELPAIDYKNLYGRSAYPSTINPNVVLFAVRPGVNAAAIAVLQQSVGAVSTAKLAPLLTGISPSGRDLYLMKLADAGMDAVSSAIRTLKNNPDVVYAEPDYPLMMPVSKVNTLSPNDPSFGLQWALGNTGSTGGTPGCDIHAQQAWEMETGNRSFPIAFICTGVDYHNPELAANIWTNNKEIPGNGIDDDGNGYVDDLIGWDFADWTASPMDYTGEGTHLAGTLGALGNNGTGISGVMWQSSIMPLRCDIWKSGGLFVAYTSSLVQALLYANAQGVRIVDVNWASGYFSQALEDVMSQSGLCVVPAGDAQLDVDANQQYPACFPLDNIITVTATDHNDALSSAANWGATSVDLGAPGVNIYGLTLDNGYTQFSGTGEAVSFVAGVAGLLLSQNPTLTAAEIKQCILNGVDPVPGLAGKCVTGGRLNAAKALRNTLLPWLSLKPISQGAIGNGSSQLFTVTVNPALLGAGVWKADLEFQTNDPAHPRLAVSTELTVQALRSLVSRKSLLDFGNIQVEPNQDTILIVNKGNNATTVTAVSISKTIFSLVTTLPLAVPAFDSSRIIVRYTRSTTGADTAVITISSDAQDNPGISVPVTGRFARPPALSLNRSSINKSVAIGATVLDTLVITNTGSENLVYSISGLPVWAQTSTAGATVAPNASSTVIVTLGNPTLPGAVYTGALMLTHNAPASANPYSVPITLTVQGSMLLRAAPGAIDFGRGWVDTGTVAFTDRPITTSLVGLDAVATVDLDKNGIMDIVSVMSVDGKVYWYSNDGLQNFTQKLVGTVSNGKCIAAGDMDQDGDVDLVVGGTYLPQPFIVWLENNGQQSFTPHPLPISMAAVDVKLCDVNHDGKIDIAYVCMNTSNDGVVGWLENKGAQGFVDHIVSTSQMGPNKISAVDLDKDGDIDFVVASMGDNTVAWYENNGAQVFTEHLVATDALWATAICVADINNDGFLDIVSGSSNDDILAWYKNDGHQSFTKNTIGAFYDCNNVIPADINKDGRIDLVATSDWGTFNYFGGQVDWFENKGNGVFKDHMIKQVMNEHGYVSAAVADIDADGDPDILYGKFMTGTILAWFKSGLNPRPTQLSLINSGTSEVIVSSCSANNPDFSVSTNFPAVVRPGQSLSMTVYYLPRTIGIDTGTITFQSDASDNPVIKVKVNGGNAAPASPALALNARSFAKSVAFGGSAQATLSVSNPGGQNLSLALQSSAAWLTASPLSGTVAPLGTLNVAVGMNAAGLAAGTYTGIISITHNDPAMPSPLALPCTLTVASGVGHTIVASGNAGGVVSPNGNVMVNDGGSQLFTISPLAGYVIKTIYIDNVDQGAMGSYLFTNVMADHAIRAEFAAGYERSHIIAIGPAGQCSMKGSRFEVRNTQIGSISAGESKGNLLIVRLH